MSFASVAWAYKDVVTSAKLAQMVENTRTHDHLTTDQGGRFGVLATPASISPAGNAGTAATNVAGSGLAFTITANTVPGRYLVVARYLLWTPTAAGIRLDLQEAMTGAGATAYVPAHSFGPTSQGTIGVGWWSLFFAPCPPPGSYTTTSVVTSTANGQALVTMVQGAFLL